jgi:hypothetical protein
MYISTRGLIGRDGNGGQGEAAVTIERDFSVEARCPEMGHHLSQGRRSMKLDLIDTTKSENPILRL